MRLVLIILFIFFYSCGKPKSVFICGDHVCINKNEAEQYFEENLSIEVKIIDTKEKKIKNLVQLNLKDNLGENKKVNIEEKDKTNEEVKILSSGEIKRIKNEIKQKNKNKKLSKKIIKRDKNYITKDKIENTKISRKIIQKNEINNKKKIIKNDKILKKDVNRTSKINANNERKKVVDVCTIIEKCSINEISKYLLKQGKSKRFPDITTRESNK